MDRLFTEHFSALTTCSRVLVEQL